ncbi:hypothetical protein ACI1US_01226 [Leucobacter sp. BZR 635]
MGVLTRVSTKVALTLLFLFTVFATAVLLPLTLGEISAAFPEVSYLVTPGFVGAALIALCGLAMIVITWVLTSMTRDDRIFTPRALRLVTALTVLPFAIVVLLAVAMSVLTALELTPLGVMAAMLGALTIALVVSLVLVTMRALLVRAATLHAELLEVV